MKFDGFDGIKPFRLDELVNSNNVKELYDFANHGVVDCYCLPTSGEEPYEYFSFVTVGHTWQSLKFPLSFIYNSMLVTLQRECQWGRLDKYTMLKSFAKYINMPDADYNGIVEWLHDLDKVKQEPLDWLVTELGVCSLSEKEARKETWRRIDLRRKFEEFMEEYRKGNVN